MCFLIKKLYYLFALMLLSVTMLFSCTNDKDVETNILTEDTQQSHYVTLSEALETAYSFLDNLKDEENVTRSCARRVENVELLSMDIPTTRSVAENLSSTLYLVNFGNDEGFALLSSDDRLRPVYAFSDEGELHASDFEEDTPLKVFLEGVKMDILKTSLSDDLPFIGRDLANRQCVFNAQCPPLIKKGVRKWHQMSPYNYYCPKDGDSLTMVGCVAVAVGQIMSYYSHPAQVDSISLMWRTIKKGSPISNRRVAYLLRHLGKQENLDMQYGIDGSYAMLSNIDRTFVNMGYQHPSEMETFSEDEVIEILDNAGSYNSQYGPVLVYGKRNSTGSAGHLWVIDGYAINILNETKNGIESELNTTYFHCLWNNGMNSGYYSWSTNIFAANQYYIDASDFDNNQGIGGFAYKTLQYKTGFKVNNN